jgi:hypothetical protein
MSRADLTAARWLGLALAVVIAVGMDLILGMLQATPTPFDATSAEGIFPILAAAPFGWLLGPAAARARRLGGVAIVMKMAIGVMILGDVLMVIAMALGSVVESATSYPLVDMGAGLLLMSLVGAVIVGPFVVATLTLPASVVWIVAFRIAWAGLRPDAGEAMAV